MVLLVDVKYSELPTNLDVIKFGVNLFTSSVALVTFHIHLVAVVLCWIWIRVDLKVCLGNYVLFANMLYSFTKASKHLPQWIAF